MVKNPTRGDATLDLIFTNLHHRYNSPEILPGIGLSDHNSVIIRPVKSVRKMKAELVFKRTVNPHLKYSFGRWLVSTDWSFIKDLPTCTQKLSSFQTLLSYAVDTFFPLQKIKQHPTDKPFITPELKILIQNDSKQCSRTHWFSKT